MGKRIAMLRESRGLSAAELARRIGIKQPSLWAIEHDETLTLKGSTLVALCEELHTTADFILRGGSEAVGIQLAAMEAELLFVLRSLAPEKRVALIEYARYLKGQQAPPAVQMTEPAKVRPLKPPKKR